MTEYDELLAQEELIADVQIYFAQAMRETGVSKSELAKRLGVTQAAISQVFSLDPPNLSLKKVARIAHALGLSISIADREAIDRLRNFEVKANQLISGSVDKQQRVEWSVQPVASRSEVVGPANENIPLDDFSCSYQAEIPARPTSWRRRATVGA